jgi:hypothetical protein
MVFIARTTTPLPLAFIYKKFYPSLEAVKPAPFACHDPALQALVYEERKHITALLAAIHTLK